MRSGVRGEKTNGWLVFCAAVYLPLWQFQAGTRKARELLGHKTTGGICAQSQASKGLPGHLACLSTAPALPHVPAGFLLRLVPWLLVYCHRFC